MHEGEIFAEGLVLNFYPESVLEKERSENDRATPTENYRIKARNLLRVLMMGWTNEWRSLLTKETFYAVFLERHHELTRAMRFAFQEGFRHIFSQLQTKELSAQQKNQADFFISNCLSYLPFADMSPYEFITVPQYVDSKWQLIDYKVIPIELTPTSGFKKLFLAEQDRVFAYGLEPITHLTAQSHLVFMGTTYPAGQGFFTTVNTDLEAFETAGKKLYRSGRNNIIRWLNQQKNNIHVCGTSLGGALSLLLALDQGDKLTRVDALNPPGLYHPFRKSKFDKWDTFENKPEVYIQKQDGFIPSFGVWKNEWHVLQVIPQANKKGPNTGADHALNYAGLEGTQFIGVDTQKDNQQRRLRNWWIYTVLRSIVYYTLMIPLRYILIPSVRFLFSHKIQTLLTLVLIPLFKLFPALLISVPLALVLNGILPTLITGYLVATFIHYLTDCITHKNNSAISKLLLLLKNQPMLQIGVAVAITTFLASLLVSAFLLPSVAIVLTLTAAAIPLVIAVVDTLIINFKILFGFNHIQAPICHDSKLMRNNELDIHNTLKQITLTYGEVSHYYHTTRRIKGKSNQPIPENKLFKGTQETKQAVIAKGHDSTTSSHQITFFASTAKAYEMTRTSRLNQLNILPDAKVAENIEQYATGKRPR